MPTIQETIDKLSAKSAAARERMKASLAAATADGVADDDKKKHFAAFDAAEKEKDDAEADLARAVKVRDAEAAAGHFHQQEREPAVPPLTSKPFVPGNAAPSGGTPRIPAEARRHGRLTAFAGQTAAEDAYRSGLWAGAMFLNHAGCRQRLSQMGPNAALNTLDNERGGYFVPDEMDRTILRLIAEEYGLFRSLARVWPMGSDTKLIPRSTGGMTGVWIHEGQAPTESAPKWDMIQLVAKKMGAYAKITEELEEDAVIDFADALAAEVALEFARMEDAAGFVGDGTSTYGGIVGLFTRMAEAGNAASVVTAAATHTTPATLTVADFDKVVGTYPNYKNARPYWMVNKNVFFTSMAALEIGAPGTQPADIRAKSGMMFRGFPVVFVDHAPTLAQSTAGTIPVLFGDLRLSSAFGDRRTNRTLRRVPVNDDALKGMVTLLATQRLDIINHTIVDARDSSKAGPVVALKLAAA